jgi:peptide-methionine (R)-S-oxide reductase
MLLDGRNLRDKEKAMINRRILLLGGVGAVAVAAGLPMWSSPTRATGTFAVMHSEDEWKKRLTPQQYSVLRRSGTERPYTSALNDEHRRGVFACAGCDLQLFSSDTKFDSGTGWPSFWAPLEKAVGIEQDRSFGMLRTSVHCSRCGGHLGHVFDDGPPPTGLRYCMNGVAMTFKAAAA